MQVTLPTVGQTVGLQFSVFGSCSDITPNNAPTMTVKVNTGNGSASAPAAINQASGTFEATFNLPQGTYTQSGSITVTCSGMSPTTLSPYTIGSPPGGNPPTLTITAPKADPPGQLGAVQVGSYPNWGSDEHPVMAQGRVKGGKDGKVYLRLTDAGIDFIQTGPAPSVPITDDDAPWEFNLTHWVTRAGHSGKHSKHYNIHVTLWNGENVEKVRICSGFFRVGE
jgi:hypothetical protein